jgi:hypothetical protein
MLNGEVAAAPIQLECLTLYPERLPRVPTRPMHASLPTARGTQPYLVQATRPINAAWMRTIERAGGIVRGYMPHNAVLVELNSTSLSALAAQPDVAWIGEYEPAYKLSPRFDDQRLSPTMKTAVSSICTIVVQTLALEDVPAVCTAITTAGGTVTAAGGVYDGIVRAMLDAERLPSLAARADVAWIEPYVPPKLFNNVAVQGPRMNVQTVWTNYGLTGRGQTIAVCDTGLDTGNLGTLHPDFTNRVKAAFALARSSWSDPHGHGTHTSGSVLGNGSASGGLFRGCAYEAQLVFQSVMDAGGSLGGLPSDLNKLYYQTYTNDARIHSNS